MSIAGSMDLNDYNDVTINGASSVSIALKTRHITSSTGISVDYSVVVYNSILPVNYYTNTLSEAVSSGDFLDALITNAASLNSTALAVATDTSLVIGKPFFFISCLLFFKFYFRASHVGPNGKSFRSSSAEEQRQRQRIKWRGHCRNRHRLGRIRCDCSGCLVLLLLLQVRQDLDHECELEYRFQSGNLRGREPQ